MDQERSEVDLGAVDFAALPENPRALPETLQNLKISRDFTIWYDDAQRRNIDSEQWEEGMQNLGKITSPESLWRYWGLLTNPENLQDGINLRLFDSEVRPSFDDPANGNGGKWTIHTAKKGSQSLWSELIISVLGNRFKFSEDINGIILSTRGPVLTISVWNKTINDPIKITTTGAELQEFLKTPSIPNYLPHKPKGVSLLGAQQPKGLKGGSLAAFKRINLGAGAPPGALVRNSVDGLAALKSGNLRASMDNSRLGKNMLDKISKQQAAADAVEAPLDPEEQKMKDQDVARAKRAFMNASSDKFPSALMSPLLGTNANKPKKAPAARLQPVPIDSPILSGGDSPEWTSSDEDEPDNSMDTTPSNSSPGGNILARLPSQDMKPENWRKTATLIKPVRGNSIGSDMSAQNIPEALIAKPNVVEHQNNTTELTKENTDPVDPVVVGTTKWLLSMPVIIIFAAGLAKGFR